MPKVSVIMAVYNGERHVREAIDSILCQTFEDFEFLIINDGSTNGTREVVLSYGDARIRLVDNEKNNGQTRSLNRGLRLARGQFVARQDADDISEPERLANQVAFLEKRSEVALLGSWYKEVDTEGKLIACRRLPCDWTNIRWSLLFYCPFVHTSVMMRKSVVLGQIGFYNEAFEYSQDFELWCRIARRLPVANLAECLVRFRINPSSMTATYRDKVYEGHRTRIETMTHLLGWDNTDKEGNEARFQNMTALLCEPRTNFSLEEVRTTVEELVRLSTIFCKYYGVERRRSRIHFSDLSTRITKRLIQVAESYVKHDNYSGSRQIRRMAYGLDWRVLFAKNHVRYLKSLMGRRLVEAMRHLRRRKWIGA